MDSGLENPNFGANKIQKNFSCHSVEFDKSGQYLACSTGNDVTIYTTGKQWNVLTKLEGHSQPVTSLAWGKDAHTIYSASLDSTVVKYYFDQTEENDDEPPAAEMESWKFLAE